MTQDATKDVYAFVPDVPFDREWSDERLYEKYNLSPTEVAFIEKIVRPLDATEDVGDGVTSDLESDEQ